jgi:phage shock protein A
MTIFSKMSDIISANINSLLEKASDPVKLSRLMIQEMQETLVEIKASVAKVLADRKRVDRLLEEKLTKKAYFEEKVQLAVDKNREDLARRILEEMIDVEREVEEAQKRRDDLNGIIESYRHDIERLENKLIETRHKSRMLDERLKSAKHRKQVDQKLYEANHEKAFLRNEALAQEIDSLDAEAEALGFGSKPSLEKEIADLEVEGEVESRLAALKKQKRT